MTRPAFPPACAQAAVLGLLAAAPAALAAFLRRLRAAEFVPPEAAATAANTLAGTALPVSGEAAAAEGGCDAAAARAFEAEYWSLPPAARRDRWAVLGRPGSGDPVAARLRELEPGLDVVVTPHPDPLVEEVGAIIREGFVLPRRRRAVRRACWMADRAGRIREYRAAARRLRADDRALADLGAAVVRRLTDAPPRSGASPRPAARHFWTRSWQKSTDQRTRPSGRRCIAPLRLRRFRRHRQPRSGRANGPTRRPLRSHLDWCKNSCDRYGNDMDDIILLNHSNNKMTISAATPPRPRVQPGSIQVAGAGTPAEDPAAAASASRAPDGTASGGDVWSAEEFERRPPGPPAEGFWAWKGRGSPAAGATRAAPGPPQPPGSR